MTFELQPLGDVVHRGGSQWQSTGEDPRFRLVPRAGGCPSGRVLLETTLVVPRSSPVAKLYYTSRRSFTADGYVAVPVDRATGKVSALIELPPFVRALRWDPMEASGEFSQGAIAITEVRWLGALLGDRLRLSDARGSSSQEAAVAPALAAPEAVPLVRSLEPNAGRMAEEPRDESPYLFFLDQFDEHGIAGWVVDTRSPASSLEIDFYLDDELIERKLASLERQDVAASGKGGPACGFWFSVPPKFRARSSMRAKLCPAGTRRAFDGRVYLYTPREAALRGLLGAAEALQRIDDQQQLSELTAVRRHFVPALLERLRADWQRLPQVFSVPEARPRGSEVIDVVVPAYRGVEQTLACIESVLAARVRAPFELVVVNDCSPEPELARALRKLAGRASFVLIENETNLGFVRSVNKAMRLHDDRDVVLLNSDTVVADGWLDRLAAAACSDANVATVTPFSNRATICSFPHIGEDSPLPEGVALAELAEACARVNDGERVDLPTAVGFCMYIRRRALDEAGYFDELRWGRGYGEENDFCLRAASLGWRHLLACDVFVQHHGSTSFAGDKNALVARNSETLRTLYPDYDATVQRFVRSDPPGRARRRLFVELVRSRSQRHMLFLTHGWGGGASVAASELAGRLAARGEAVLVLSAGREEALELSVFGSDLSIRYAGDSRHDDVLEDLRALGVWQVQVHQLLGFGPQVYDLLADLAVPYDVTVHDYFYVCPRVNLIDGSERYCGEPDESACDRCLDSSGPHETNHRLFPALAPDIRQWRSRQQAVLGGARLVIAPSGDVEARMQRYFDLPNLVVKPHPETRRDIVVRPPSGHAIVSVAVIGAIGMHKGFTVLKACAEDARQRGLALRFVVVGYTCDDRQLDGLSNVVITGKYEREELGEVLRRHDCEVAAFLSVCPETFSYTLSEALVHGLYPVAFDLGAQAERIRALPYGTVLPFDSDPAAINDALIEHARRDRVSATGVAVGRDYPDILADYYQIAEAALERRSGAARHVAGLA